MKASDTTRRPPMPSGRRSTSTAAPSREATGNDLFGFTAFVASSSPPESPFGRPFSFRCAQRQPSCLASAIERGRPLDCRRE
jgi:hypothetical protein